MSGAYSLGMVIGARAMVVEGKEDTAGYERRKEVDESG